MTITAATFRFGSAALSDEWQLPGRAGSRTAFRRRTREAVGHVPFVAGRDFL